MGWTCNYFYIKIVLLLFILKIHKVLFLKAYEVKHEITEEIQTSFLDIFCSSHYCMNFMIKASEHMPYKILFIPHLRFHRSC